LQNRQKPRFAEFVTLPVSGFGHAIRVDHQQVMRFKPRIAGLVVFLQLDTQGNIVSFQSLEASVLALKNRRIVAGAKVAEVPRCRIQFGKKSSGEASRLAVSTHLPV